jgi:hypothetical protein
MGKELELTRIATVAGSAQCLQNKKFLQPGMQVEVLVERFGGMASVTPIGCPDSVYEVPVSLLTPSNSWTCSSWVAKLPRPSSAVLEAAAACLALPQSTSVTEPVRPQSVGACARDSDEPSENYVQLAEDLVKALCDPSTAEHMLGTVYEAQIIVN